MAIRRKITKHNSEILTITIGYAYGVFENEKKAKGLVEATMRNYKQSLAYLMEYNGLTEESSLELIDRDMIVNWTNMMRDNGLTPAAINHYLRDARAFLYWCMHDNRKYIEKYSIEAVKGQEPKQKTYTKEEIKRLLAKPKRKENADFVEWRNWTIFNLIYDMGARASTLINIQMQDINLDRRSIYLRHTKNQSIMHSTISTQCAKVLKEYIADWRADADPTDYLFCNYGAEQLTYNALAHSFTMYCTNRGVQHHSLHGVRHSFATALAENTNGDMIRVQKALGHKSIDMARKYINLANIDMGDYDAASPLSQMRDSRGRPKKSIKRNK